METRLPVPSVRQGGTWVPSEERHESRGHRGDYDATPSRHVLDFGEVPAGEVWSVERIYAQTQHFGEDLGAGEPLRAYVMDRTPTGVLSIDVTSSDAPHILARSVPADHGTKWTQFELQPPIRLQEQQSLVVVFEGTESTFPPGGAQSYARAQLTILRRV